jgi:hypothetical protein
VTLTVLILSISGIGMLLLAGQSTDTDVEISSVDDFLRAAEATGTPRIRVYAGDTSVSLLNGDVVAISDEVRLGVTLDPYPPSQFDVDVDLHLTTTDGLPIEDASVEVVWDMMIMGHGPFTTAFEYAGDGHYRAPLHLFMFGPWELEPQIDSAFELPDDLSISLYLWPE